MPPGSRSFSAQWGVPASEETSDSWSDADCRCRLNSHAVPLDSETRKVVDVSRKSSHPSTRSS
eukprot:479069-Pleurochrysis_carterae.AAC.1